MSEHPALAAFYETPREHFDLVVIGSGPAGEKGAAQAAYFGKGVCVIERAPKPGGAAVNTGTLPSKTLRETALYFSGLRQRGLYGVDRALEREITVADVMFRERKVVEQAWSLIEDNFARHRVTVLRGTASFVDPHTVAIGGRDQPTRYVTGEVVLIASGSTPQQPEQTLVDGTRILDSDSLLELDHIPQSMIVVGGGVIGCEYACIFAALGVRVTLVNARSRLLAHMDADVGEALRGQMASRLGIAVRLGVEVRDLAATDRGARVTLADGTRLDAECVLFSAGRLGNTADLGLEMIGVRTNARGFIQVDEHYHTGVSNVYAAGDVIGFPALASTSMEQARVAMCHAFDLRYKQRVASVLPYGVWTIPEIAAVGESEESLTQRGVPYVVGRAGYALNARAQIVGDVDGFVKLIFRPEDQRLLGVAVVGENACELVHIGMGCLAACGTIDYFIQSVFNYPSLGDAYKYAAYDGLQQIVRWRASPSLQSPAVAAPAVRR